MDLSLIQTDSLDKGKNAKTTKPAKMANIGQLGITPCIKYLGVRTYIDNDYI